jgi:hypothetical protein
MKFEHADISLTLRDISDAEKEVGLSFPTSLRNHYLTVNGGSPNPYVYEDENVDTTISECLPLRSTRSRDTAIVVYQDLVISKGIVPTHFFPFAIDSGGDYLFVDCSSVDGDVYLYQHDTIYEPLVPLRVGLDEFWARLKPE